MISKTLLECCPRDCPERRAGCQIECGRYREAKARYLEEKREITRRKARDRMLDGFAVTSTVRNKKRKRCG